MQISKDGALVLGPCSEEGMEKLYVFSGDQPGSFELVGYRSVLDGGVEFPASLAQALFSSGREIEDQVLECTKKALLRVR